MEYCDDDREYIRVRKTNPECPSSDDRTMGSEATPWMMTPITRQQLQGMSELRKREKLTELVNEETREVVLGRARAGYTSYLWIVNQGWLECKLDEQGWANSQVTMDELRLAVRALYPDCDVTLHEEEVVCPARLPPKSLVRKGIKIEWS
jgi:hypothetical protein